MTAWGARSLPLEEAILVVEHRRLRRWFTSGWRPLLFVGAMLLLPWVVAPMALPMLGIFPARGGNPQWPFGVLIVSIALGCGAGAFLRASQFWHGERNLGTLETWLLTRQSPARVVAASCLSAAIFGLLLAAIPLAIEILIGLALRVAWWQWLESLLLVLLCATAGAAAGGASLFIEGGLAPKRWSAGGFVVLTGLILLLWLRSEAPQRGWSGPWDQHPVRFLTALSLMTPVPSLFGIAAPEWWDRSIALPLALRCSAAQAGLLAAGVLAAVTAIGSELARSGFERLWHDPERLDRTRGAAGRAEPEAGGNDDHWHGFRNPVWTREIRTRLRSRDTAEFIFVASLAVAAGGFVPLFLAARDLEDPLLTAGLARQVFYWLTMTLMGLVGLVTPGLASEAFASERRAHGLDFLIGSPLRRRDILAGKVLGSVSVVMLLLSPSLPLFGLCYLFRGASGAQLFQVCLLLSALTVASAFIGVCASAIYESATVARWQTYGLAIFFIAAPGGAFSLGAGIASPVPEVRRLLAADMNLSFVILIFCAIVLVLFGGNARERLRYSQ